MPKQTALRVVATVLLAASLTACDSDDRDSSTPDAAISDDTRADDAATTDTGAPPDEDTGPAPRDASTNDALSPIDDSPIGPEERPAEVVLPDTYNPDAAYPLVFLLHGYGGSAGIQDVYMRVSSRVDDLEFILILPNGQVDPNGSRYWNATSWCCDFFAAGTDDTAYLNALIDDAQRRFNVDPRRVYFMGHSNGGFMSYRMACEHADRVAAVASLAGSGFVDADACAPSEPVAVLQAHGTADSTILYTGNAAQYPGAEELMQRWATRNGCEVDPQAQGQLDLTTGADGSETDVFTWPNCEQGTSTTLWKMNAAPHIPSLSADFSIGVIEFLLSHAR